jgi:hypothetical protein
MRNYGIAAASGLESIGVQSSQPWGYRLWTLPHICWLKLLL